MSARRTMMATPAVVDEAVVVEPERLGDVRGAQVVLDGERLLHHGVVVQAGVLAEGHRDRAELLLGGAVEQLVALEEERVERALRRHAPRGVVEVRGDGAAGHPGAAVGRVHRALRVAVDQGDGRAEPRVDGEGRLDDALGGVAAAAPARVQAPQLAGPLAGQGAGGAQAVDVVLLQARIVQRALQRPRRQGVRVVPGLTLAHGLAAGAPVVLRVVRLAHADHRHRVFQSPEPRPVEAHRHRPLLRSPSRSRAISSPRRSAPAWSSP